MTFIKGHKHSKEALKKMSKTWFPKGHVPLIKGKYHTEETKEKMRKNSAKYFLNKDFSEEHKQRISESRLKRKEELGYINSPETREKISKALKGNTNGIENLVPFPKGNIPWSKGKKMSKEYRGKLSRLAKENGFGKWMVGKKLSKETKKKISIAGKGRSPWNKGKKPSKETLMVLTQGRLKQANMNGPTSIEKKVYDELKARGILFEKQKLINGKFLVDAYIPSLNLVIEADGDYWHSLDRVKKRDKAKNAYLTKCGYNLLRLTGTEIRDDSFNKKLDMEIN